MEEARVKATSSTGRRMNKPMIPDGILPGYLASAFGDLLEEDGLLVLGRGLGLLSLLAAFVRFYSDTRDGYLSIIQKDDSTKGHSSSGRSPLVIVLGLRESEIQSLVSILESFGTPQEMMPVIITNETGQGKDRSAMYKAGGVFCITSRILIVDLLSNILSPKEIDGMLITHADEVTHESTEAFIVRIYASQKRRDTSFIKAFTNAPEGLFAGFGKIDKTLKALQVRKLHLYPRFHDVVRSELESTAPDVEELHQPLPPSMKEIQSSIATAVRACMKELKNLTPLIDWTSTDLAIENCVTSSFDRAIQRQLDQDWHRLKPQVKQLSYDLKELRSLFDKLVAYDCVQFWKLINNIKSRATSSRNPSMWLLSPAAEVLFRKAKERIYKIKKGTPTQRIPHPVSTLIPVLEGNPKWTLLGNLLDRIRREESHGDRLQPATILIVVRNERNAESVRSFVVEGRDRTLALRWLRYLENYNDRSRSVSDCNISEESRLLLEEEQHVKKKLKDIRISRKRGNQKLNEVPAFIRKRRRIAVEKGRGQLVGSSREDRERNAVLDEALEEIEQDSEGYAMKIEEEKSDSDDDINDMYRAALPQNSRVVINTLDRMEGDAAGIFLCDLEPQHVILYDFDIAFVRSLEIYSCLRRRPNESLKVYFLMFQGSSEQKVFSSSIEREQSAFERLIHHKQSMPPPVLSVEGTQEMQQAISASGSYDDGKLPLAFDSRKARKANAEKRDIAVDVREFRSALPSILHQGGMRLAPVTLTVGDFVLSTVHCVERKSISDLFGSFASGRLYTQAEQMSKYYKCPCLLIEFDPAKSFSLQNSNEIGVDIKSDSICSKIVTLTSHFALLRILWSKSPYETLKIFRELKANHDEVDVERAMEVGRDESAEALLQSEDANGVEDEINEAARDMLLRLPGVNVHSASRIMRECDSIAELAQMDRMELRRIAGPVTGQKLFRFFRQSPEAG